MSLYVVESLNFENRRTKQVDFSSFLSLENLLDYISSKRYSSIEVVIDDLTEPLLKGILSFIEDKELSIGLLCKTVSNKDLLAKYNIYLCKNYDLKNRRIKQPRRRAILNKGIKFKASSIDKKAFAPGSTPSSIDLDENFRQKLFRYLNKSKKPMLRFTQKVASLENYSQK